MEFLDGQPLEAVKNTAIRVRLNALNAIFAPE
jgi:hypothetical protein